MKFVPSEKFTIGVMITLAIVAAFASPFVRPVEFTVVWLASLVGFISTVIFGYLLTFTFSQVHVKRWLFFYFLLSLYLTVIPFLFY